MNNPCAYTVSNVPNWVLGGPKIIKNIHANSLGRQRRETGKLRSRNDWPTGRQTKNGFQASVIKMQNSVQLLST